MMVWTKLPAVDPYLGLCLTCSSLASMCTLLLPLIQISEEWNRQWLLTLSMHVSTAVSSSCRAYQQQ